MINNDGLAILIPVYNDWDGFFHSIESIDESINMDLIVVNDGSRITQTVENISKKFTNGKVFLINLEINKGIVHALNEGLQFLHTQNRYTYIARLDCGDLCLSNRFYIQMEFLNKNLHVTLLGSQVQYINTEGLNLYKSSLPTTYKDLKKGFHMNCYIIHPTVMFKTDLLNQVGFYPTNYPSAEDYGFFFKILKENVVMNLDSILLKVLVNENGISALTRKRQVRSKLKIQREHYYFGFSPTIGILRNIILYFVPRKGITLIRKFLS
jgi:glycosyltransferase involved in cell wall biosynthesis